MRVFVGVEGFALGPLADNLFIVKELFLLFSNDTHDHYLFKAPTDSLCPKDQRTVRYITKHLNHLAWFDGEVQYSNVERILKKIQHFRVYTYGKAAKQFLLRYLPTTAVINIQEEMGCKMPNVLEQCECFRKHPARYCAKAKGLFIKNFVASF